MMHNETEAKRVYRNFNRQLDRLTDKARNGDREAAVEIISRMTAKNNALHKLGYRTTDEDEDKHPTIVPITKEWIIAQKKKETKLSKLTKRIRAGDRDAAHELVLLMAEGEE